MGRRDQNVHDVAVDLGTSRVRVATRTHGVVLDEPNVVLRQQGAVVAVGEAAWQRTGPTRQQLLVRPVQEGVVEDFNAVEALLRHLLGRVGHTGLLRPRVLFTLEQGATEVGVRALSESIRGAGARTAVPVEAALCRTLGVGLGPEEPMGNLLLDVGAGGARASLCSLGGVVLFRSTTAGGDALSAAIRDWLARERGIEVSRSTAETLKEHVVDVSGASIRQTRIRGTAPSGQPVEQVIGSQELDAVLQPLVSRICGAVTDVLTDATPELSADILDRGLVLTGEAARLRGLSDLLGNHTQLPVVLAEPLGHAQITGAAMLLSDRQRLEGWTSP